jgi:hypothetical protein
MVRTQNAKMLHELLDAKLVVIEDCGHMLNLESPERYRAPTQLLSLLFVCGVWWPEARPAGADVMVVACQQIQRRAGGVPQRER